MPMVKRGVAEFSRLRILISGLSNSGKTWGIRSFDEEGKSLVILVCPGEAGVRSVPEDTERITSYYYETVNTASASVEWSKEALHSFEGCYSEIEKNKPDKLFIDGIHHLYEQNFNIITNGDYFAGNDLDINPKTGKFDPHVGGKLYSHAHTTFGQRLAGFAASAIPFIGITVLEDWQEAKTESDRPGQMQATRYLWPSLPGKMALNVVHRFDARISARLEMRCIHSKCEKSKNNELHHVWQFYPRNDVMGVGIKGLTVTESMTQKPYIHQTWPALRNLLGRV